MRSFDVQDSTAAPRRLYLMRVATLPPPDNTPAVCYLVQTGDGRNILIDSGIPEQLPPGMPPLVLGPSVIEQLAALGLRPDDIDTLVCTHFDLDHAGRHGAFPRATFVVQRAHYEAALGEPRFAATRAQWEQPAERYRLVEGDTSLLPGLDLIESSGHVPGHQSVLLRLPATGPVLLTIDAVPDRASFTRDRQPSPRDMDGGGTRASTEKLITLAEREGAALVIFGHDGAQWQRLKLAPDYYE
jgi:N-acyl homoserine lactone hydrolase